MRTHILSTFLYESWTLTAEIERRIQALEMRCYRRLLNISYKDHVMKEEVRNRIQCNWSAWWSPNHGKEKGNSDGMATSQDPRACRRQFCRGQWKEQEEEADRRRDRKREWGLEIPWGQWKTGKGRKVLLQRHLWCPDYRRGYGTEMRWHNHVSSSFSFDMKPYWKFYQWILAGKMSLRLDFQFWLRSQN